MTTDTVFDTSTTTNVGKPRKVVLFNDEDHSMDEVAAQIIQAIHCSMDEAFKIMLTAHNTGRAVVFTGSLERCEHVAAVLDEIRLGTKIEEA